MDLYQLLKAFWRRKILFGLMLSLSLFIGILLCVLLPPVYRSKAVIMPLKQQGVLLPSSLADIFSFSGGKAKKSVAAVLESRTLRERVIERLELLPALFPKKWDEKQKRWRLKGEEEPPDLSDGSRKLKQYLSFEENKRLGTMEVIVDFPKDPELAYQIARAVLEEAATLLRERNFNLARKNRLAIEKRLEEVRAQIKTLEQLYKDFAAGKIKEVPLIIEEKDLRPKLALSKEEEASLAELRLKLQKLKSRPNFVAAPDYQLNVLKLKAQLDIALSLYELLLKQHEITRAQELQETIAFQIVDPPSHPKKKRPYKPKKFLILALALIGGTALGIFAIFLAEWWQERSY